MCSSIRKLTDCKSDMQMSVQRVPRVWFILELSPARRVREYLSRMLERHRTARFGPVRSFRLPILPVSQLLLKADDTLTA